MAGTNTQRYYLNDEISIQFPPLTPEQNSQRCREIQKKRVNFDGTRKSRKNRAELTKKQWRNPKFREKQKQAMLNGKAALMGRYPKPGLCNHSFAERNEKIKKCREMIRALSVIENRIDRLSDEELDNLYYKLFQW